VRARPVSGVSVNRYRQDIYYLAKRMCRARPTMVVIEMVVRSLIYDFERRAQQSDSATQAYNALASLSLGMKDEFEDIARRVVLNFRTRFSRLRHPMVISYSSRVLQTIGGSGASGRQVTVCESRTAYEGRRTARLLAASVASVTLITEAQIGIAMNDCDSVVLGCDAVYADGSIINKTGSYLLALAAKAKKRPVIVLGDTYKLAPGKPPPSESHPLRQVWGQPPKGIRLSNVCFEEVPAALLDFYVMQDGVYTSAQIKSMWKSHAKRLASLT